MRYSAWTIIPILLMSACAGPAVRVATTTDASDAFANLPVDLRACTIWGRRGVNTDQWLADKFGEGRKPFFKSVHGVANLEDARDCDIAVKITVVKRGEHTAQVYSAYTREPLLTLKTANDTGQALWTALKSQGSRMYDTEAPARLGAAVFEAFKKDSDNYRRIARERKEHEEKAAAERSAKALSGGGMSTKDIQALTDIIRSGTQERKEEPQKSSDIDRPGYKLKPRPEDFALVIGISDYQTLPAASFAERDAATMREHLVAQGLPERNIVHLAGNRATLTGIKKYIEEWLPRNAKPESRIFFYFSGHGAPSVETQQAYLVPWDGDANFLNTTAYPVKKLYSQLSRLPSKDVVVALDTCFSGSGGRSVLAKGARPLVTKVDEITTSLEKLTVFAAASSTEITGGLEDQGHGIFTYFFIKGLSGAAKDPEGRVTARSLHDYLSPRVSDAARRQNRDQSPVLTGQSETLLSQF